jgi:hypothetical protein
MMCFLLALVVVALQLPAAVAVAVGQRWQLGKVQALISLLRLALVPRLEVRRVTQHPRRVSLLLVAVAARGVVLVKDSVLTMVVVVVVVAVAVAVEAFWVVALQVVLTVRMVLPLGEPLLAVLGKAQQPIMIG